MEDHSRTKRNSRGKQLLGTVETVSAQARQSLAHHVRLKPEMPTLSYSNLHHQYTKSISDISHKRSGNLPKQHRKATQEEELVKYMSNLPSYLERGEYCQDKVLNFGVLDWSRLEKWQCTQKQRRSSSSLPSSISFSSLSTEGSSGNSSSGQSCSPAQQRLRRPSLQFHLMSSSLDAQSQNVNSVEESIQKFQLVNGVETNTMIQREKHFSRNVAESKLDTCKGKDLGLRINPENEISSGANFESKQKAKIKTNTRDGECMKMVTELQGQKSCAAERDVSQNTEGVVLLSKDLCYGDCSKLSKSITMSGCNIAEGSRQSFSGMSENIPGVVNSNVPHSCPLIFENNGCTETKWCFSDAESTGVLPDSSHSEPHSASKGYNPSRGRISEIKKSSITPTTSSSKEPSTRLELQPSQVAAEKPRSTSPFRRLSIGMSKISKSFSSKGDSSLPHSSTPQYFAKSSVQNAIAPSCHSTSSDTQNAATKSRSIPLRRLLDPLLKPKAPNCHQSAESLPRDLVVTEKTSKLYRGQIDSLSGARRAGTCREVNKHDSSQEKRGSSAFQAFLRVAVKNGQPLFTFAVGNEQDIFAATIKKLSSSREDDYACIYTFFSVKEIRNKNGRWLNQGGKGKSCDYIPNVIAQLKVSSSQFSQSFAREFVLFSVDLKQAEQQTLDLQANDELAAIVVMVPKSGSKVTNRDGNQSDKCDDFPEVRCDSTSGEHRVTNGKMLDRTTVILPGGVHSLPNKGGLSSLIHRWRSGGSCDCGGWDLGCKLKVFSNKDQHIKKSSSPKACLITDKFELVSQGVEEENRPVFRLAPFKEEIYSVEFTSPLSVLQAFSLCIAVLDSKELCDTLESSKLTGEGKASHETILVQNDGIDGEIPGRYVSNPPHSPVGRV